MTKKIVEMDSEVKNKIEKTAEIIWNDIKVKEPPVLRIPVRGRSNIFFDEEKNQILLKNPEKFLRRNFMNVAHSKKFMQTLHIANYCYQNLLKEGLHCTIRDLYYAFARSVENSTENVWDDQRESNSCIEDLEIMLGSIREQLHLNADPKGMVVGPAVFVDHFAGQDIVIELDKQGSGGWAIPSNVEHLEFKEVDVDYVLVVEKSAAFDRLNEDMFWKKNNCLLIATKGQAARGARRLIQRLSMEKSLPIYVVTDADGYGWYIYSTIKFGSMKLAYLTDLLATPAAKFLGVSLTDLYERGLEKQLMPAEDQDLKRTRELMDYAWFKKPEWQTELKKALETKKKGEIEAFTRLNLRYLTNVYLPEKIENKEFLP
ncbi:MAG: DNA topoisomerase IV subunit A [Nitrososphaeria archaeon]